jgi:endonuclease III
MPPDLKTPALMTIVRKLASHYGPPAAPPTSGAFEMVLWESVAYLADDERRAKAFALLKSSVGTTPAAILKARGPTLRAVTEHGILAARFAEKLREAARIVVEECGGDLDRVVAGPLPAARKALKKFPGIGNPGAEKILLFLRRHPSLAPESNGLRVLTRLGLCGEEKSYAASYAVACDAAARELGDDLDVLMTAHRLLRRHGQVLCTRSGPGCERCPIREDCRFARGRESTRRRPG